MVFENYERRKMSDRDEKADKAQPSLDKELGWHFSERSWQAPCASDPEEDNWGAFYGVEAQPDED